MNVENSALIEEKKSEKRVLQDDRNLIVFKKEVRKDTNHLQKKNKELQDNQDHFIIPQVQIFG